MNSILITVISITLEFFCLYYIGKASYNEGFKPSAIDIFTYFIIIISGSLLETCFNSSMWLLGQVIYALYFLTYKKLNIVNRVILYCFTFSIALIVEMIMSIILILLNIEHTSSTMYIVGNLITLGAVVLFDYVFHLHIIFSQVIKSHLIYKLLFISTYTLIISIAFCFKIHLSMSLSNMPVFLVMLTCIVIFNISVLFYDKTLEVNKTKLKYYQNQLPVYQALIDDIKASQHEFSNRLQHIEKLPLVCKDYESLSRTLLSTTEIYRIPSQAYSLLGINAPLLAASLYTLYIKANNSVIRMSLNVHDIYTDGDVPEYDLADFASILVNNAIDECKSGDTINLNLHRNEKKNYLEVVNPLNRKFEYNEMTLMFNKNYSTKNKVQYDSHEGMGLYYLRKKISEYGGDVSVQCTTYNGVTYIIMSFEV